MIRPLMRVSYLTVRRDAVVLALTFALPIIFFSIFALIFGDGGDAQPKALAPIATLLVDEDRTATSAKFLEELRGFEQLQILSSNESVDREDAQEAVRSGKAAIALVAVRGFSESLAPEGQARVAILFDASNPVARYTLLGLSEAAAQRTIFPNSRALLAPELLDVRGKRSGIAYSAAGMAVMFLLFSVSGAAGALLIEEEGGTLERILVSGASMRTLLGAYFTFSTLLGCLQVTAMFLVASFGFGVELFTPNRLLGFAVMTTVTSAAASAFGLLLATACRTRGQLSAVSTLAIMLMSAAGGSMIPRYVMPAFMQTVSRFTFNGWAIDGYLQVFWFDDPRASVWTTLARLAPTVAVLVGMTFAFGFGALRLARRWEAQ